MVLKNNSSRNSIQGVPLQVFIEYSYIIFCTRLNHKNNYVAPIKSNSQRLLRGLIQ